MYGLSSLSDRILSSDFYGKAITFLNIKEKSDASGLYQIELEGLLK